MHRILSQYHHKACRNQHNNEESHHLRHRRCVEPNLLRDDQIKSETNDLGALTDDETRKLGEMGPERTCFTLELSRSVRTDVQRCNQ